MKAFYASTAAALMMFAASAASAAERTVTLAVKNMSCATCGPTVQKSLTKVAGVKRVEVSVSKKTATVVFDDAKASVAQLVAATTNAGYPSGPTS